MGLCPACCTHTIIQLGWASKCVILELFRGIPSCTLYVWVEKNVQLKVRTALPIFQWLFVILLTRTYLRDITFPENKQRSGDEAAGERAMQAIIVSCLRIIGVVVALCWRISSALQ